MPDFEFEEKIIKIFSSDLYQKTAYKIWERDVEEKCPNCPFFRSLEPLPTDSDIDRICTFCIDGWYHKNNQLFDQSIYDLALNKIQNVNRSYIGNLTNHYRPFLPRAIQPIHRIAPPVNFNHSSHKSIAPSQNFLFPSQEFIVRAQDNVKNYQKIITLNLDYTNLPKKREDLNLTINDTITIGDLHGNTLTLIIILIQCGILMFTDEPTYYISSQLQKYTAQNAYKVFADIIKRASKKVDAINPFDESVSKSLSSDDYETFVRILERHTRIVPNSPSIRLLGDLLADRTSNDALTLAIIGFLYRAPLQHARNLKKPRLSVIMSNHDNEFMLFLANLTTFQKPRLQNEVIMRETNLSAIKFLYFYNCVVQDHEKIKKQIKIDIMAYVRSVIMFDTEIVHEQSDKSIFVIYSHASFHPRISLAAIKMLAYQESTDQNRYPCSDIHSVKEFFLHEFKDLLDNANKHLRNMCIAIAHTGFTRESNSEVRNYVKFFSYQSNYVWLALWLRLSNTSEIINLYQNPAYAQYQKPYLHNLTIPQSPPFPIYPPYGIERVRNIHGHDNNARVGDISLNNYIGQGEFESGDLEVIISYEAN